MKVRLRESGTLEIEAETELESFALRKWLDDFMIGEELNLKRKAHLSLIPKYFDEEQQK